MKMSIPFLVSVILFQTVSQATAAEHLTFEQFLREVRGQNLSLKIESASAVLASDKDPNRERKLRPPLKVGYLY